MAEPLTLDAVLEDLQAIEPLILNYEKTYKVLTPHFDKLYRAGKLEENWDFIDWSGLYEIKLRREKAYRELLAPSEFAVSHSGNYWPSSCAETVERRASGEERFCHSERREAE